MDPTKFVESSTMLNQIGARPDLLVSVRSLDEALAATAGGASIIDIKEPRNGPLGAASPAVWREICQVVPDSTPITVALGEAKDFAPYLVRDFPAAVSAIKLGPAGINSIADYRSTIDFAEKLAGCTAAIVAYADHFLAQSPAASELVDLACHRGCRWLLIDTYVKDGKGLFGWLRQTELEAIAKKCAAANVHLALAGQLHEENFARAYLSGANVIAIRGAACVGNRLGTVSAARVRLLQEKIRDIHKSRN